MISWIVVFFLEKSALLASLIFISIALIPHGVPATLGGAEVKRTDIKRVMILPFVNLSDDKTTDFLSFAIAFELAAKLSQTKSIAARVHESAQRAATDELLVKVAKVARESNADYLLTGTYLKAGDRLLLNTRLMNVRANETLWSAPLEPASGDLRPIPEILFRKIIMHSGITLSAAEEERLRKDKANDATAYELYLRAIALRPETVNDWQRQRELFEQVIELDPAYAPALAALANAHMQYASKTGGGAQHYEKAEIVLRRALSLNGESHQTLLSLGSLYAKIGKSEESAALLQRALRMFPQSCGIHATLGYVYRYAGLLDESIASYRQAQTLDASIANLVESEEQIVKAFIYKGDNNAALASHAKIAGYREAVKLPDDHKELFYAGMSYLYLKEHTAAAQLFDRATAINAASIWSVFGQAYKAAVQGDRQRLSEHVKTLETLDIVDGERRYRLAHFYSLAGQPTPALHNLKIAIEGGFFNYPYISRDPLLAAINGADEFKTLLREAKKRHQIFKRRFGAGRERS